MKQLSLSRVDADQLYHLLEGITNSSQSINQQIAQLGGLYANTLKRITKTEKQFFANAYTRSVFVFDTYAVPETLVKQLNKLGYLVKEILNCIRLKSAQVSFVILFQPKNNLNNSKSRP